MDVLEQIQSHIPLLLTLFLAVSYLLYYRIFSYFNVHWKGNYDTHKKNIGKHLPPYPNGWYIACNSSELHTGTTKAVDISGQNLTLIRSTKGQVYALHSYCAHMGANLGIGGTVVNQKCVQCPFHGWLYDGQTGQHVGKMQLNPDHDGKPVLTKTIEYNDDFCSKQSKGLNWHQGSEYAKQHVYRTHQLNGFIYVWLHADPSIQPYYMMLDNTSWISRFSNRGQTIHDIRCHVQDIPQNGADVFHFKYIHKYLYAKYKLFEVSWVCKWKRGDDPSLPDIFEHRDKSIRTFKQNIYNTIVKNIPNKQYYSFANVDNYIVLPLIGHVFLFNFTVIQMGPGLVNIFLKTKFFEILFLQYVQTQDKFHQRLYHEMYASSWLPYWLTSLMLYAEGMQVYYDLLVWDAKRVSYKLYYKDNDADQFIKAWRGWFSQHYQGCDAQLQPSIHDW